MTDPAPDHERPWGLYITVAAAILLVVAGFYFASVQDLQETGGDDDVPSQADRQQSCEAQLAGILAAVDPRELGISSSQTDRAHDLNLWRTDCGALLAGEKIALDEELVRRELPADFAERVLDASYAPRDAAHLRTALLLRQTAEHVIAGIDDAQGQAVTLFNFVHRNVLEVGPDAPTMTPYEVLLIGRGSPQQRAWLFAELLRQIELDAVLIQPADAPDDSPDKWLLGVPVTVEGASSVLLFDSVCGIAVPSAAEQTAATVTVTRPATLAEVRENDALFRELDLDDAPYRFKSADFSKVRVGLIGNSSIWSNRMAALDFATELRGAIFYDGLGKNRLREPPQWDRIAEAGAGGSWSADDLFVWSFPEQQLTAFGTSEARGRELLANYFNMLAGPEVVDYIDPMTGAPFTWNHPLIRGRHLHITGAYQQAILVYNRIRSGVNVFTVDPRNDLCRESAVYWTAGCQYELGSYDSVVNTGLGGHYPPNFRTPAPPIWNDGMLQLTALSLAQVKAFPQAAQLLRQLRRPAPHGVQYLARRWERLGQQAAPGGESASEGAVSPDGDAPPAGNAPAKPVPQAPGDSTAAPETN